MIRTWTIEGYAIDFQNLKSTWIGLEADTTCVKGQVTIYQALACDDC
jgi:hypothetical protein